MKTCDKEGCDGEEVVSEIALVRGVFIATVNHDPSASFKEAELQHFECKSSNPVALLDHILRDQTGECSFQKGMQSWPFKVDAGSDVFNENLPRVRFLEIGDSAVEISSLFCATKSGVNV